MFQMLAENAVFGVVLGVGLAFPILVIATKNIITGFLATFTMCCSTVSVIGVIPLAGWKLGVSFICSRIRHQNQFEVVKSKGNS